MTGLIGAQRLPGSGRTGRRLFLGPGFGRRLGNGRARHRCLSPSRRRRRTWGRHRPAGDRLLDRCLLRGFRDGRDRRLCRCIGCRNEHDVQIGRLDPSLLPGKTEARKPGSLTAVGQAEQHGVNQQGDQQRKRQAPALTVHALTGLFTASCGSGEWLRRRGRRRCLRGAGTRGTQACSFVAARALLLARAGLTCPGSFEPLFSGGWLGWVKGDAAAWARAGSSRRGCRADGLHGPQR